MAALVLAAMVVFAAVPSRPLRPADLGLKVQAFSAELAKQFSLEKTDGVVVTAVEEESPADRGGLRAGDIILMHDESDATIEALAILLPE